MSQHTHAPCPPPVPPRYLYGILGQPLGHSLSPALHNWAFARLGHAGAYFCWEKSREELPDFFSAARCLPISGLSVTIPHKEAVGRFLDELTPRAQRAGAVNTVYWRQGRLTGDNTDVAGFLEPLGGYAGKRPLPGAALILGAGGVCRAALTGLRELGFARVTVAARTPAKARALAEDFGCDCIPWHERERAVLDMRPLLVINATPLGMRGSGEGQSPLPETLWRALKNGGNAQSLAYDLVYAPAQTPFLSHARAAGVACIGGLPFFIAQAMEQLRLWMGAPVPARIADGARVLAEGELGLS